jgi:RNA polymerase sigma factor (sigma-70 family)
MDTPHPVEIASAEVAVAAVRSNEDFLMADLSFEDWVAGASGDLLRFARMTTRNVEPADLVQDALTAVFTRWPKFDDDADRASSYARRVILNSHISRWRRWGRQVTPVDPLLMNAPAGQQSRTDDILVARKLLATLPLRQRAAVFLRFYDDLSYRQIADILGCREATARSHVHRALNQLQQQLDERPPYE